MGKSTLYWCRYSSVLAVLLLALGSASAQTFMNDWQDKLSKPTYPNTRFQFFEVPMPDGVKLAVAVWRPYVEGKKFPVILIATPYNKLSEVNMQDAVYFVPRGYVYVAYDLRGRYDSEGYAYLYGPQDGKDLNVMQSWVAHQPWSDGKIGMYQGSYLGFIQWEGALQQNPNLTALIPETSPDDHYDNVYPSGAFQLSNSFGFLWSCCGGRTNEPGGVMDWAKWYEQLPIKDDAKWAGIINTKVWDDLVAHTNSDSYYHTFVRSPGERIAPGKNGPGKYGDVKVPTFNLSGWYDQVSQATINNFVGMVTYGPADLRKYHKLMMGPWTHGGKFKAQQGQVTFPNQAALNGSEWRLRWFDHWLKGMDNGFESQPPVTIYVMGADLWRNECEWPLKRTQDTKYYLHSGGRANSLLGDGTLDTTPPAPEPNDHFIYNPAKPVPTLGGNVAMQPSRVGPYDQTTLELRSDVLVFTTPPLKEDVEITGPIILHLFASTDRTDTDFTGKLVDVYPDGNAQILLEGVIRGRHWKSFQSEDLLTPGKIYDFYVDLWSTSNVFQKGHRIRIDVSSSNFPKYDRNPNTGHKFGEDAELLVAHQTIYHDAAHPSHVVLPIIPAGSKPCDDSARTASH
ncbi:MAG TPA: CocE/NonD family hydrolase [Candidatus Dormibacteraeota bacterium]|nr:CocE/NonD family hydrolase [Candidatus Dormibacteraeota bacterium]